MRHLLTAIGLSIMIMLCAQQHANAAFATGDKLNTWCNADKEGARTACEFYLAGVADMLDMVMKSLRTDPNACRKTQAARSYGRLLGAI
jgi:hypothetical protein